jgi:hypothetical protein
MISLSVAAGVMCIFHVGLMIWTVAMVTTRMVENGENGKESGR